MKAVIVFIALLALSSAATTMQAEALKASATPSTESSNADEQSKAANNAEAEELKSLKDLISKGEKVAAETEARATEEEKNLRNAEIAAQASDTANEKAASDLVASMREFIPQAAPIVQEAQRLYESVVPPKPKESDDSFVEVSNDLQDGYADEEEEEGEEEHPDYLGMTEVDSSAELPGWNEVKEGVKSVGKKIVSGVKKIGSAIYKKYKAHELRPKVSALEQQLKDINAKTAALEKEASELKVKTESFNRNEAKSAKLREQATLAMKGVKELRPQVHNLYNIHNPYPRTLDGSVVITPPAVDDGLHREWFSRQNGPRHTAKAEKRDEIIDALKEKGKKLLSKLSEKAKVMAKKAFSKVAAKFKSE